VLQRRLRRGGRPTGGKGTCGLVEGVGCPELRAVRTVAQTAPRFRPLSSPRRASQPAPISRARLSAASPLKSSQRLAGAAAARRGRAQLLGLGRHACCRRAQLLCRGGRPFPLLSDAGRAPAAGHRGQPRDTHRPRRHRLGCQAGAAPAGGAAEAFLRVCAGRAAAPGKRSRRHPCTAGGSGVWGLGSMVTVAALPRPRAAGGRHRRGTGRQQPRVAPPPQGGSSRPGPVAPGQQCKPRSNPAQTPNPECGSVRRPLRPRRLSSPST
jgi:hypothetical protein